MFLIESFDRTESFVSYGAELIRNPLRIHLHPDRFNTLCVDIDRSDVVDM